MRLQILRNLLAHRRHGHRCVQPLRRQGSEWSATPPFACHECSQPAAKLLQKPTPQFETRNVSSQPSSLRLLHSIYSCDLATSSELKLLDEGIVDTLV